MNDLQRRQVEETQYREIHSKQSWARQHAEEAGRITVFHIEDQKHARLHNLKEAVADLCDMQPTPANMLRPPRKVRPALHRRASVPSVCGWGPNHRQTLAGYVERFEKGAGGRVGGRRVGA